METKQVVRQSIALKQILPFTIKEAVQEDGKDATITGYASTFGNIDRYNDVMVKGCFKKSLKKNKGSWIVKLNHYEDIGVNVKAKEDEKGLYVESKLFTGSRPISDAEKAVALIMNANKYKHPMGLSIGGYAKEVVRIYNEKTEEMKFEILEFDILEHSITSIPANPQAEISSLKSIFFNKNNDLMIDFLKTCFKKEIVN